MGNLPSKLPGRAPVWCPRSVCLRRSPLGTEAERRVRPSEKATQAFHGTSADCRLHKITTDLSKRHLKHHFTSATGTYEERPRHAGLVSRLAGMKRHARGMVKALGGWNIVRAPKAFFKTPLVRFGLGQWLAHHTWHAWNTWPGGKMRVI